jgi:hypothetical protein
MTDISDLPLPYYLDRSRKGPVTITAIGENRLVLSGRSNYGTPCQDWADRLAPMTDEEFTNEAAEAVYWSAWADNNPTSDYHWQASACYYEAQRRGDPGLYQRAYDQAKRHAGL